MVKLLTLGPATWNKIVAFLCCSGAEQGYGVAWYQLAELTTIIARTFELEILWAKTFKLGVWQLRRREEELLESIKLPRQLWIKYRLLGRKHYRIRSLPPPTELITGSDLEWAPWLEQRKLEFTIEAMDNAEDWRDIPHLRGGSDACLFRARATLEW